MRQFILYLFIAHFATGGMAGEALVRIPDLVEHYNSHRKENPAATFLAFLEEHYSVFHSNHRDQRHAALPFHFHKCQQGDQGMQLPTEFYGLLPMTPNNGHLKPVFFFDFHLPTGFGTTLLQPPKVC